MNKKIFTVDMIRKFNNLNESVIGTDDYNKYSVCMTVKTKKDGKWGNWIYAGWASKIHSEKPLIIKTFKGTTYLVTDEYDCYGHSCMDRYEITDIIKEALGL